MIIETERLILRPFLESDAEDDVYESLKEPAVNCFACMKLALSTTDNPPASLAASFDRVD